MKKMECWTLVMCLLSTTFAIPLPQHPGYINFSYEYPRYGYEPMGGWMHQNAGPVMNPTHFHGVHAIHPALHQIQPQQPSHNPHMQQPGHNPLVPMNGQSTLITHYHPSQHPLQPQAGEFPMQPQQPVNPDQSMHPQQPGNPNQPIYPVQPLPPLIPDTPLESWPVDKTKQEEVD